jgi:YqaJ-like viral recombinase domain
MKIHNEFAQNSLEWLNARAGVITASEVDALFTGKLEPRRGQMVDSFLAKKVAEQWIGGPLPSFQTIYMEFGQLLEQEAIPYYEFMFSEQIKRVSFITSDDGKFGCSPDGLIGDDGGLECKCSNPDTHTKVLLAGRVPEIYIPQIHFSLFVTGRKFWRFMSYRRNFPAYVTTVERDDKIMSVMNEALYAFCDRLDSAYARLVEMNGGPPRSFANQSHPLKFEPDLNEVPIP